MLKVSKDLTIDISYGDIFDVPFKVTGLEIAEDAKFYFAVSKILLDPSPLILEQCSHISREANSVRIVIESAEMKRLPPGKYYYELYYKVGENRRALNYPARLVVWEVVHNEWS